MFFLFFLHLIVHFGQSSTFPLTCTDLIANNIFTLSYSGSHHYLDFGDGENFNTGLGYRVYSDWDFRGQKLFPALLDLSIKKNGKHQPFIDVAYSWRPDFIQRNGTSGSIKVKETAFYADQENLGWEFEFQNNGTEAMTAVLSGGPNSHGTNVTTSAKQLQVTINIVTNLTYHGSGMPEHLELGVIINMEDITGAVLYVNSSDNSYHFEIAIPPGEKIILHLNAILMKNISFSNPYVDSSYEWVDVQNTTHAINAWLASVSPPTHLTDPSWIKMYYSSWFQFWYNTEAPTGYWNRAIITPSMTRYGRAMWLWDSSFHVMALRYGDSHALQLAQDQILVLVNGNNVVGHLPRVVSAGYVDTQLQAPGILTWCSNLLYKETKDKTFLTKIYDALAKNNNWWYINRDPQKDGLCEWSGPDSGWDNSPRWDNGTVEAIDLNSWLCLDQQQLSVMAGILGKKDDQTKWLNKANKTAQIIRENLWHDEMGLYFDRLPSTKELIRTVTPATYWSMLGNIATNEQAKRMVKVLEDPTQLWTPYPMPVISKADSRFNPENYWRGPVWININYLTILALENYGYNDLASNLRSKSIELVAKNPEPREYYNPLTGGGLGAQNFMWTGALYIAMINEVDKKK